MSKKYAIAYANPDGSDFHGAPLVEADFSTFQSAEQHRQRWFPENSQRSFVFLLPDDYEDFAETITWEYAESHRVDKEG